MEATRHVDTATNTGPRAKCRRLDLDMLSRMDVRELGELYARGTTSSRLGVLAGHPRGRMLAVRALDRGAPGRLLRAVSSASAFPWGGKSFCGDGERGTGLNRVHLFGRHQLFPFLTRIQPSALDGAPSVALDYDLPDNPGVIRSIHDEIREVDPGLFLGPAMWKTRSAPKLVLWFALDTHAQALPVGSPTRTS